MTSGRKLTRTQLAAILELLGRTDEDGRYLLTQTAIAEALDVNRRTVSRAIRDAAVREGRRGFSQDVVDKVTCQWPHTPYDL